MRSDPTGWASHYGIPSSDREAVVAWAADQRRVFGDGSSTPQLHPLSILLESDDVRRSLGALDDSELTELAAVLIENELIDTASNDARSAARLLAAAMARVTNDSQPRVTGQQLMSVVDRLTPIAHAVAAELDRRIDTGPRPPDLVDAQIALRRRIPLR